MNGQSWLTCCRALHPNKARAVNFDDSYSRVLHSSSKSRGPIIAINKKNTQIKSELLCIEQLIGTVTACCSILVVIIINNRHLVCGVSVSGTGGISWFFRRRQGGKRRHGGLNFRLPTPHSSTTLLFWF